MEVWSRLTLEKVISLDCFIRIYYMILLHKYECFINCYDVLRALQEQLSTHKKQEQRNGYQTNQLTFKDAHLNITYITVTIYSYIVHNFVSRSA